MLLLLLSRFSRVRLRATPETAAHQAPPSLGFSRQEHWSGLPFPSPMHESEKSKWSRWVVSNRQRPHGLQPTRLLRPWDFPGKSTGGGCLLRLHKREILKFWNNAFLKHYVYFVLMFEEWGYSFHGAIWSRLFFPSHTFSPSKTAAVSPSWQTQEIWNDSESRIYQIILICPSGNPEIIL